MPHYVVGKQERRNTCWWLLHWYIVITSAVTVLMYLPSLFRWRGYMNSAIEMYWNFVLQHGNELDQTTFQAIAKYVSYFVYTSPTLLFFTVWEVSALVLSALLLRGAPNDTTRKHYQAATAVYVIALILWNGLHAYHKGPGAIPLMAMFWVIPLIARIMMYRAVMDETGQKAVTWLPYYIS